MKRLASQCTLLLLVCGALLYNNLAAQQIQFRKIINTQGSAAGKVIKQTADNGYITLGEAELGPGYADYYLAKTDSAGSIIWSKTYGGDGSEWVSGMETTHDGGYIIGGSTASPSFNLSPAAQRSIFVVRTNSTGDTIWRRLYEIPGYAITLLSNIRKTSDGNYLLIGDAQPVIVTGKIRGLLIKIDTSGNILWSKTYAPGHMSSNTKFADVVETSDKGFVITGSTLIFSNTGLEDGILLFKTDSTGNPIWNKRYIQHQANEYGNKIIQSNDGGFCIGGVMGTGRTTGPLYGYFLMKTNSTGDTMWTRCHLGGDISQMYHEIIQTADSGFVTVSERQSNNGVNEGFLVKFDKNGDSVSSRYYGKNGVHNFLYSAAPTSDGGFVLTGTTWIQGNNTKLVVLKTDSTGNSGCDEISDSIIRAWPAIKISDTVIMKVDSGVAIWKSYKFHHYSGGVDTIICFNVINPPGNVENPVIRDLICVPNPFSQYTIVRLPSYHQNGVVVLHDHLGERVYQSRFSGDSVTINRNSLPSGLYFCSIFTGYEKPYRFKLVIN